MWSVASIKDDFMGNNNGLENILRAITLLLYVQIKKIIIILKFNVFIKQYTMKTKISHYNTGQYIKKKQ